MKICSKCKIEKDITLFSVDRNRVRYICKECDAERRREYRKNNLEKCRECVRNSYSKDIEKSREYQRKKYRLNRQKYIDRITKNPFNRLSSNFSRLMRYSLIYGKRRSHWEDIVGYTKNQLIVHLEEKFVDGMNWENYGKWHIDHIIPRVLFKYDSYEDYNFKKCWSLENLQPLWASDNKKKYSKVL